MYNRNKTTVRNDKTTMEAITSTKDPVINTDSNDDVSTSVNDTRKMAPVDDDINNSRMQMDDMVRSIS